MKTIVANLTLVFFLLLASSARAQQPCESADCENQNNQSIDIHTESDVSKAAVGLPGGVDIHPPNNMNDTGYTRNGQPQLLGNQGAERQRQQAICPGPECPALPPEARTEFQKFVFATTGERLSIYGRNLFEASPSTFAPVDRIPVPADYVIGPGDELMVRAWGQIDVNVRLTVDRNGQIYLPRVGTVNVAGIRYDQLTSYLKNTVSRVFKNFDLNVTLGQLRSVQIFVVGQARRPGSYTVSSLSTLVTALFASGGPSVNGSMRHIVLKRQNKVVTEFDVYDLLSKGDKSKDVPLLPGDVIYIPPVGRQIAVMGSVNLPGIYEIDDQTTIQNQIEMAGGLSTTADGTRIVLERIENRTTRKVVELKMDQSGMSQALQNGDLVRIFPVSPKVENAVVLRGNVALPGRYPWHQQMRISDLIPSKAAIITRDYWLRQSTLARDLSGWPNPDEGNTKSTDEKPIRVSQSQDAAWSDGHLGTEKTSIARNPSEINWDYAVVQRMNHQDLSSELIPFNLGQAISDHNSEANLELEPGDVITIFTQSDLQVPSAKKTNFVTVEGEVKAPGVYRLKPGETLREVVERAGGIMPEAYLYASELTRVSVREEQQKRLTQAIDDMERELSSKAASILSASSSPDDQASAREQLASQQELIQRLKKVDVAGRIVLDLKPEDHDVSALPAVPLEDGDTVIIPPQPATVMVIGSVYNQGAFLYKSRSALNSYLSEAGGTTREADKGRLFVIRADGAVVSSQMHKSIWFGGFNSLEMQPGDTVVVPQRIKTGAATRGLRDWTQVFSQLALTAAALSVVTK